MPRKSRRKSADMPASEPTPVAAVLEQSPIAQILASRDARAEIEPDQPMPTPLGEQAIAAFQRQRASEQPAAEMPDPSRQLPAPEARPPSDPEPAKPRWVDRYKPMRSYPNEGVRMVEARDHSRVGIAFDNDKPPTQAEKLDMQFPDETRRDRGFAYEMKPKVWEQEASPESRDAAMKLADKIAQRRREDGERER